MNEKLMLVSDVSKETVLAYKAEFKDEYIHGSAGLTHYNANSIDEWYATIKQNSKEDTVKDGLVPESTYAYIDESGCIIGMISIRHRLNKELYEKGGHIGYSILPSKRQQGHATRMLELALEVSRDELYINPVLITCDKNNVASEKVILTNGGIFENERESNGEVMKRFWVYHHYDKADIFQKFEYQRIDVIQFCEDTRNKLKQLNEANAFSIFKSTLDEIHKDFDHVGTMITLASIRYSINTKDYYYEVEQNYWDMNQPYLIEVGNDIYHVIRESKYLKQLKEVYPKTYFMKNEMDLKTFSKDIIEELQEENVLVSKYSQLMGTIQIEFEGKTYSLAGFGSKLVDLDEDVRKRAMNKYWESITAKEEDLDDLYDKLVKLRTKIAKKLGYENFIELGYYRMQRLDYTQTDVELYREQILHDIVPLASELYKRQQQRIGVDRLEIHNLNFEFKSGNPKPRGNSQELVTKAKQMYRELSPETETFFNFMVKHQLLDLDAKQGKAPGGYCTFIDDYAAPFIFANFNGTRGDVDVLTHEAGHAFQVYSSKSIEPSSCRWPTLESCEIHSMSMEFFTWPWMPLFFEDDAEKYYYVHLSGAIKFLPYGVLVDHFQHEVYRNPDMSKNERKQVWRTLEKKYLPHLDYSGVDLLERGGWWFKQGHVFSSPFYYIDYTLAQVCALQFFSRIQVKDENAFADYYHICKLGGTLPFTEIVKAANLNNPFKEGSLSQVKLQVKQFLDKIDDQKIN